LLKVFNTLVPLLYNVTSQGASKLNYDTVMDPVIEVASQVVGATQVTHHELTFPVNLKKIFPNSEL
jgi:hypothetical protein